jgi:hypothetical protein
MRWGRIPPVTWFACGVWVAAAAFWIPGGGWLSPGRIGFDPAWTVPVAALGAAAAGVGAVRLSGWRAVVAGDPRRAAHRALYTALQALPYDDPTGEMWLNRDAHQVLVLRRRRWLQLFDVSQVDEDDITTIDRDGSGDLVLRSWQVARWSPDVVRLTTGAVFTGADLKAGPSFAPASLRQRLRGNRRARKAGLLYAAPDELTALTVLLSDAERY